jgi:hypothetical protein
MTEKAARRSSLLLMTLPESSREGQAWIAAFKDGLQKVGWLEGRNIQIDGRWGAADLDLMQQFAREIISTRPDLILAQNTPNTLSLLQQTRTIPHHFCERFRSGRQRSCCKPARAWRQRHWVHQHGRLDERQVAGAAQGDGARD